MSQLGLLMIKYLYAKDANGEIVNINSLNNVNRENQYSCISCGNELIAKRGDKRIHHFAHKGSTHCSSETYLHSLSKIIFENEFNKCVTENLPFYFNYFRIKTCNRHQQDLGLTCDLEEELISDNLINYFNRCKVEEVFDEYRPDILLYNDNPSKQQQKLFIEFAVSHFLTSKKINSGYRIIEIQVKAESDLLSIQNHFISEISPNVELFNFKIKNEMKTFCESNCLKQWDFFTITKQKKSFLDTKTLSEINRNLLQYKNNYEDFKITPFIDDEHIPPRKLRHSVVKSYLEKKPINSCFLCKYHVSYIHSSSVFCKFPIKNYVSHNQAIDCSYFKFEAKYLQIYLDNTFENLKQDLLSNEDDRFEIT